MVNIGRKKYYLKVIDLESYNNYMKNYYEKNKEKINRKRREKYKNEKGKK